MTYSAFQSVKLLIFSSFMFVSVDATNTECLARYVNDSGNRNCTIRKNHSQGRTIFMFAYHHRYSRWDRVNGIVLGTLKNEFMVAK